MVTGTLYCRLFRASNYQTRRSLISMSRCVCVCVGGACICVYDVIQSSLKGMKLVAVNVLVAVTVCAEHLNKCF